MDEFKETNIIDSDDEAIDIKKVATGIIGGIALTAATVGGLFFYLVKAPVKVVQKPAVILVDDAQTDENTQLSFVIRNEELPTEALNLSEKITVMSDYETGSLEMPDTKFVFGREYPVEYKIKDFKYTVTYSSQNEDVATIDENGVITVHSNGMSQITAKSEDASAVINYVVNKAVAPAQMPETATVFVGQSKEFVEVGEYEVVLNPFVSEDETVATVTENGYLFGIKQGTTNVSTTLSNGETGTTTVHVVQPVTEIQVSAVKCYLGNTTKVVTKLLPEGADFGTSLSYEIYDTSIAKVDGNGTVTGIKKGSTTITVTTENGVIGSAILTVTDATPRVLAQGKQPTTSTQGNYDRSNPAVKAVLEYVGKKRTSEEVAAAAAKAYGKTGTNFLTQGKQVSPDDMQSGDIIYWKNGGGGDAHFAVYIGDGMAVHGDWSGGITKIASAFYKEPTAVIRLK